MRPYTLPYHLFSYGGEKHNRHSSFNDENGFLMKKYLGSLSKEKSNATFNNKASYLPWNYKYWSQKNLVRRYKSLIYNCIK